MIARWRMERGTDNVSLTKPVNRRRAPSISLAAPPRTAAHTNVLGAQQHQTLVLLLTQTLCVSGGCGVSGGGGCGGYLASILAISLWSMLTLRLVLLLG